MPKSYHLKEFAETSFISLRQTKTENLQSKALRYRQLSPTLWFWLQLSLSCDVCSLLLQLMRIGRCRLYAGQLELWYRPTCWTVLNHWPQQHPIVYNTQHCKQPDRFDVALQTLASLPTPLYFVLLSYRFQSFLIDIDYMYLYGYMSVPLSSLCQKCSIHVILWYHIHVFGNQGIMIVTFIQTPFTYYYFCCAFYVHSELVISIHCTPSCKMNQQHYFE